MTSELWPFQFILSLQFYLFAKSSIRYRNRCQTVEIKKVCNIKNENFNSNVVNQIWRRLEKVQRLIKCWKIFVQAEIGLNRIQCKSYERKAELLFKRVYVGTKQFFFSTRSNFQNIMEVCLVILSYPPKKQSSKIIVKE